jgi:hypothetical protein
MEFGKIVLDQEGVGIVGPDPQAVVVGGEWIATGFILWWLEWWLRVAGVRGICWRELLLMVQLLLEELLPFC